MLLYDKPRTNASIARRKKLCYNKKNTGGSVVKGMQRLTGLVRKAIQDYEMIAPGDRVLVGVSGGKDSVALTVALGRLRAYLGVPFTVQAVTLDPCFGGVQTDYTPLAELFARENIPYEVRRTDIGPVVFDYRKEPNPCALCAKLRRGSLNDAAREQGCGKVALGHHFDDAVETFMLSLFYEGRLSCFRPVTYLDRTDLTVIRPMLYMTEREVINFAARQALPICKSGCPVDKETKREDIKQLLRILEHDYHDLRQHIFGAMQRLPLDGWAPSDPRGRKTKGGD